MGEIRTAVQSGRDTGAAQQVEQSPQAVAQPQDGVGGAQDRRRRRIEWVAIDDQEAGRGATGEMEGQVVEQRGGRERADQVESDEAHLAVGKLAVDRLQHGRSVAFDDVGAEVDHAHAIVEPGAFEEAELLLVLDKFAAGLGGAGEVDAAAALGRVGEQDLLSEGGFAGPRSAEMTVQERSGIPPPRTLSRPGTPVGSCRVGSAMSVGKGSLQNRRCRATGWPNTGDWSQGP